MNQTIFEQTHNIFNTIPSTVNVTRITQMTLRTVITHNKPLCLYFLCAPPKIYFELKYLESEIIIIRINLIVNMINLI